jgi:hypothetical protein
VSSSGGEPARAQAFYCPYCGEEELRPAEEEAATHCPACDRRFVLRFAGLGPGGAVR